MNKFWEIVIFAWNVFGDSQPISTDFMRTYIYMFHVNKMKRNYTLLKKNWITWNLWLSTLSPLKKKTVKKFVMCSLKREINRDHECNHRADELLQRMIYCLLCFHHLTLSFLLHLSFFVFFCLLSVFCLLLLLFRTIKVLHWFGYLVTGYARCYQADQYPGLN